MDKDHAYYRGSSAAFRLYSTNGNPAWRPPQLGALGALAAHWSLPNPDPALVSLPTGTGKTAIAVASAYLANPRRVLVVVPSTELRRQIAAAFRSEEVLLKIGALSRAGEPIVCEIAGRVNHWDSLEYADVVVALPNTISPVHYGDNPPPMTLFDLVIADEAHHAPAPTWRAIFEHFKSSKALLLTATPQRRDGQRLPGSHVYHYPLRQALIEGIFKPVEARILEVTAEITRDTIDHRVADEVAALLSAPEHSSSTLLIRAANRQRASELAALYQQRNIPVQVLHSGLGYSAQRSIIDRVRTGDCRAVAVVGMLVEGFDLPSLRILAYHDKYKSLPATAQIFGRLARVDTRFPQPSVIVTVRDIDVYPELRGVVRQLYEEDSDWATVLPGIIDDEIAEAVADRKFIEKFTSPPPVLSLEAVHPMRRSVIFEMSGIAETFALLSDEILPTELQPGRLLRGSSILYSDVNRDTKTLLLITMSMGRPRWHNHPGLDNATYELHVVSYRESSRSQLPSLLFLNTDEMGIGRELLDLLHARSLISLADPARLQAAFDSLNRASVSSVGVRNTYARRGSPSYRMFAGSGVDRGLRESDTAFGALGHAMVQVLDPDGAFTAGISTGKGKFWETRYSPLRTYEAWVTDLAERYWFPPASLMGQLLPQVSRGKRITEWPKTIPVAAEFDFALIGRGWYVSDVGSLDVLDLRANSVADDDATEHLLLELINTQGQDQPVVWRGYQDCSGNIRASGTDLPVHRGFSGLTTLSDLLSTRPPTIFFLDGSTVQGATINDSRAGSRLLPDGLLRSHDWTGVNIRAETRSTASQRAIGKSVHEALEEYLTSRPRREKHRWILCNDGAGELADYIVLEVGRAGIYLDLWHAKYAGGDPSVRVTDVQEVVAQAIKSRRWITDFTFWEQVAARLSGRALPPISVVEGSTRLLNVLYGEIDRWEWLSFRRKRPIVTGMVGIVQPGLSQQDLERQLRRTILSAVQIRDLFLVFVDSVSMVATVSILCSD